MTDRIAAVVELFAAHFESGNVLLVMVDESRLRADDSVDLPKILHGSAAVELKLGW